MRKARIIALKINLIQSPQKRYLLLIGNSIVTNKKPYLAFKVDMLKSLRIPFATKIEAN